MNLPPYSYLFLISAQPSPSIWKGLKKFIKHWNDNNEIQFEINLSAGEEAQIIEFPNYKHPDCLQFQKELTTLKESSLVQCFEGIVDNRLNDDFIGSDFVQLGEQFYDEDKFFLNANEAFEEYATCNTCNSLPKYSLKLNAHPIVDVEFLNKKISPNIDFSPQGIDLIGTPGQGTIVSKRLKEIIENSGATGVVFLPVIEAVTLQVSNEIYLLAAKKAITDFCPEHTPRESGAICRTCGSYKGKVYGSPIVESSVLRGDEVFSLSPFGHSGIMFSNRLYEIFLKENVRGMYVLTGIDDCQH
jgi:hypothetical protein